MRKLTFLLFLALTAPIGLQANNINDMDAAQTSLGSASQRPLSSSAAELAPYLAGAVPEVNGKNPRRAFCSTPKIFVASDHASQRPAGFSHHGSRE